MRPFDAHWRGHLFLFDAKRPDPVDAGAALRLVLIALVLEGVIGPRLSLFAWLGIPIPPSWIRVPVQLVVALVAVRLLARVPLASIGLRAWREWSATERSYFVQVVVAANAVFAILYASRLRGIASDPQAATRIAAMAAGFLWGAYQEVVYRGILQTGLVRRWGAASGIAVATLLFAFGPLHFYHFATPSPAPMFAAILAIGLFFAVLFHRSGNLAIVATFHGIGDAWITGTLVA